MPATQAVATAAMRELLRGPEGAGENGLATAIPAGTELKALSVDGGLAKVELTTELDSRAVSQIVYTLTQFPSVRQVVVAGGEPLARELREEDTPQILVESPLPGARIASPLHITGTANTFEATFNVQLFGEDGEKLAEKFVTATSGNGTRGTFDEQLEFEVDEDTPVTLVAFEPNASSGENGTPPEMHRVDIPIVLVP